MKIFTLVLGFLVSLAVQAKTDRTYIPYKGNNIFSNTGGIYIQSAKKDILLSDEKIDKAIDELMAQSQQSNVKNDADIKSEVSEVDRSSEMEQVAEPEYESYDKRWVNYNDWGYSKIENDFNNRVVKAAELISNDGNATLAILYDAKDKKYQNFEPETVLDLKKLRSL